MAISQSGETADTLRAAALAKRRGATLFAVTNAKDSSLARAADRAIPICAGEEVAVASTKAYNCQLIVLYLMGLEFARAGGTCSAETEEIAAAFDDLPRAVGEVLSEREKIGRSRMRSPVQRRFSSSEKERIFPPRARVRSNSRRSAISSRRPARREN